MNYFSISLTRRFAPAMSHILSTISATFMSVVGPIFTITAPSASWSLGMMMGQIIPYSRQIVITILRYSRLIPIV